MLHSTRTLHFAGSETSSMMVTVSEPKFAATSLVTSLLVRMSVVRSWPLPSIQSIWFVAGS